jgi:hypothetical protein
MHWVHDTCGGKQNAERFVGRPEGKRPLERYEYIYRRIILVCLSKKLDERVRSGFTWLKMGTFGAFL